MIYIQSFFSTQQKVHLFLILLPKGKFNFTDFEKYSIKMPSSGPTIVVHGNQGLSVTREFPLGNISIE